MSRIRNRWIFNIDHCEPWSPPIGPPHPLTPNQPDPLLTAFFSGVPVGEVADRRFSRFISLLLGSLRVLFSSLMLAWCFSKTSCDLSRNWKRMCRREKNKRKERISRTSTPFLAAALTSTRLICMTGHDVVTPHIHHRERLDMNCFLLYLLL